MNSWSHPVPTSHRAWHVFVTWCWLKWEMGNAKGSFSIFFQRNVLWSYTNPFIMSWKDHIVGLSPEGLFTTMFCWKPEGCFHHRHLSKWCFEYEWIIITLHVAGFSTSSNTLILPSQFWQIRFESYWLHCSKCRILVLLWYLNPSLQSGLKGAKYMCVLVLSCLALSCKYWLYVSSEVVKHWL